MLNTKCTSSAGKRYFWGQNIYLYIKKESQSSPLPPNSPKSPFKTLKTLVFVFFLSSPEPHISTPQQLLPSMAFPEKGDEEDADTPIRYVSLDRVYSSASVCVSATNSSNVMSKKVKARKLIVDNDHPLKPHNPPVVHVYSRRLKRPRQCVSFYDSLLEGESQKTAIKSEIDESLRKKRRIGSNELANLGVDSSVLCQSDRPRLRDCRNNFSVNNNVNSNSVKKRKHNSALNSQRGFTSSATAKKWVRSVFLCSYFFEIYFDFYMCF